MASQQRGRHTGLRRWLGPALALLLALGHAHCAAAPLTTLPEFVSSFVTGSPSGLHLSGKRYFTSFETVDEFKPFYIVPPKHMGTATHELSAEHVVSGKLAHKATVWAENPVVANTNTNHRAYPTIRFEKTDLGIVKTAVVVDFWVWDELQLRDQPEANWLSLATFTSYNDTLWPHSYLINVGFDRHVRLMHVPHNAMDVHDIFQTDSITLPPKQWVRITAYIDYQSKNRFAAPFIAVWQDGQLVSAARFDPRVYLPGALTAAQRPPCVKALPSGATLEQAEAACKVVYTGGLAQAHFGLYAAPRVSRGAIYNDDLTVAEVAP